MASQLPLLTFNSLYGILREERKNKVLQTLPERFYEALENFFNSKKSEIKKLKENKDEERYLKERRIYKNSKKIIQELISLRLSKISSSAIKSSLFGESFLSENTLKREKDFFNAVNEESLKIKRNLI